MWIVTRYIEETIDGCYVLILIEAFAIPSAASFESGKTRGNNSVFSASKDHL